MSQSVVFSLPSGPLQASVITHSDVFAVITSCVWVFRAERGGNVLRQDSRPPSVQGRLIKTLDPVTYLSLTFFNATVLQEFELIHIKTLNWNHVVVWFKTNQRSEGFSLWTYYADKMKHLNVLLLFYIIQYMYCYELQVFLQAKSDELHEDSPGHSQTSY